MQKKLTSESVILKQCLIALSENGCIVWRNTTAGAWTGKLLHREADTVVLGMAKMIHAGLVTGGSDIIGIQKKTGRFIAIEVKAPRGKLTKEQEQFLNAVRNAGGIAGVARSAKEAIELLNN